MTTPLRIERNEAAANQDQVARSSQSNSSQGTSFADTLSEVENLKFSSHAQKRLEKRNITLTDEGLTRLNDAVNKAEKRGGQESLVLLDDLAFIVNVKDRMVVTAMDADSRKDGVFTQIDSVVFAEPTTKSTSDKSA